jgi:hypothetical protein
VLPERVAVKPVFYSHNCTPSNTKEKSEISFVGVVLRHRILEVLPRKWIHTRKSKYHGEDCNCVNDKSIKDVLRQQKRIQKNLFPGENRAGKRRIFEIDMVVNPNISYTLAMSGPNVQVHQRAAKRMHQVHEKRFQCSRPTERMLAVPRKIPRV